MVDRISRHQHQKLLDREFDPKNCFRNKNLKFVLLMVVFIWDKLGKFCYDEARRKKKLDENTIKVREVLWKFCWSANEACVEFYSGCCEELVVFFTFGAKLSSRFITFASYHTFVVLQQCKLNIPFEYLSWDDIQEGSYGDCVSHQLQRRS